MHDYLNQLNEVQRKAVEETEGPGLIIAGAGSGKTRVLTYRIAHLLALGNKAGSILALTFTNKAAREMKERISLLVGAEQSKTLWMGTFHSIFARILRSEAEKLGYTSNFTIYDSADSKNLIKTIVKELQLDDKTYKPGLILGRISKAKNNLVGPNAYENDYELQKMDFQAKIPETTTIYKTYMARCKRADAMDFDDLLVNTNLLFRDFPDVLTKYQRIFKFVLVDEYQDTNYSQYLIIKKIAAFSRNICVVGDDAQSIYAFRGAKIENILNFKVDYPDFRLYKLEQNYRSTQIIVNAANSLISKNKNQIQKQVFSKNEIGSLIKIIAGTTDHEEGFLVCNQIVDLLHNAKADYRDFAILYRTNAQSRIFEEVLRKKNIPYKIYGGLSFYQRKEIKDILAYFRLAINPRDEEALKRVINYPARGIGDTSIEKLQKAALEQNKSIWEICSELSLYNPGLGGGIATKIIQFVGLIAGFTGRLKTVDAYELANQIANASGILKELKEEKNIESMTRLENIEELINGIREYVENATEPTEATLDNYIQSIALLTDLDEEKEEDFNKVTLMTIHSAKGLEFKYVYIVGLEEKLFPSQFSLENPQELEEERRLFYVAITRAELAVCLSYAAMRFKWGSMESCVPSRFIREIDEAFIETDPGSKQDKEEAWWDENPATVSKKAKVGFSRPGASSVKTFVPPILIENFVPDDPGLVKVGMQVLHERFGAGKVLQVEGTLPNAKATVFFQSSGQKMLLLKFARLKIVN